MTSQAVFYIALPSEIEMTNNLRSCFKDRPSTGVDTFIKELCTRALGVHTTRELSQQIFAAFGEACDNALKEHDTGFYAYFLGKSRCVVFAVTPRESDAVKASVHTELLDHMETLNPEVKLAA
jgi:hypothetical protein